MTPAIVTLAAAFGLVVGSFMNNYVWRVFTEESIIAGRSRCPKCKHELSWRDLVPVMSWLFLRGRCRYCDVAISRQYPAFEVVVAVMVAISALVWQFDGALSIAQFGVWIFITGLFVALAVYDIRWMLLPNRMLKALFALIVVYQLLNFAGGAELSVWLISPLLAGAAAFGFFYMLFILGKGNWMGGGDVKLVFLLGLLLGGAKTAVAMFLAFNVAAIISVAMLAAKVFSRKDLIPFGPYLLMAAWVALLFGNHLIEWYLTLTGLKSLL